MSAWFNALLSVHEDQQEQGNLCWMSTLLRDFLELKDRDVTATLKSFLCPPPLPPSLFVCLCVCACACVCASLNVTIVLWQVLATREQAQIMVVVACDCDVHTPYTPR